MLSSRALFVAVFAIACSRTVSDFQGGVPPNVSQAAVNDGSGADTDFWPSATSMTANWQGFPANAGRLEYNLSSGRDCSGDVSKIAALAATATSVTTANLTLKEGALYFNCVRAVGNNLASAWVVSNGVTIDTLPPLTPGAVSVSVSSTQAFLNWSLSTDTGSGVFQYQLAYCSPAPCPAPATPQVADITAGFVTVADLQNCQPYDFFVRAVDGAGNASPYSPAIEATPTFGVPQNVHVWAGLGWAEFSFDTVPGAEDYQACWSGLASPCDSGSVRSTSARTTFVQHGIGPGQAFYAVRAVSALGTANECIGNATPDIGVAVFSYSTILSYDGPYLGAHSLMTVAGGADYDGDGVDDVVVGWPEIEKVPGPFPGQPQTSGIIEIVSGKNALSTPDVDTSAALPGPGAFTTSDVAVGTALAMIDGPSGKVLIGASGNSAANSNALMLFGGSSFSSCAYSATTTSPNFADAVAAIGDFYQDGVADYAIAAPNGGDALVFSGKVAPASAFSDQILDAIVGPSATTPITVSGIGDVNGDGVVDIAVGTPGPPGPGTVSVYLGSVAPTAPATTPHYSINGLSSDDDLGSALAPGGDVNGDGFSDFLVGHGEQNNRNGAASVRSGADGSVIWTKTGSAPLQLLGNALATVGDIDDDGLSDFAFSAPGAMEKGTALAGAVFIYSGAKPSNLLFTITSDTLGAGATSTLGQAIAPAGDVDGDGHLDLILSVPSTATGSAFVLSGKSRLGMIPAESDDVSGRFGADMRRTPFVATTQTLQFTGSGGHAPYTFSLINALSGGNITATATATTTIPAGFYTAGPKSSVYDTVRITDTTGQSFDTRVYVGAAADTRVQLERPVSITATPLSSTSINLVWKNWATTTNTVLLEYRTPANPWQKLADGLSGTVYEVDALTPNTIYFFRMKAQSSVTDSPWSPVIQTLTPTN